MVYIDKNGSLRNSEEDIKRFADYTRERAKHFRNSPLFLRLMHATWEKEFGKKAAGGRISEGGMSEMVERAARAAKAEMFLQATHEPNLSSDRKLERIARAVICAMREPTEAMVRAVRRAKPYDMDLTEAWPIAIDEALK